jgi:hypothetical protein
MNCRSRRMGELPDRADRTWRDGPTSAADAPGSTTAAAAAAAAAPPPVVLPNGRPRFAGVPPPVPPDLPDCFCIARVLELGAWRRSDRKRRGRSSELGGQLGTGAPRRRQTRVAAGSLLGWWRLNGLLAVALQIWLFRSARWQSQLQT